MHESTRWSDAQGLRQVYAAQRNLQSNAQGLRQVYAAQQNLQPGKSTVEYFPRHTLSRHQSRFYKKKTPSTGLAGNMVNSATCKLSIRQHARSEGSSCGRHRLEWRYQDVRRGSKSPPGVMLVFGVGLGDGFSAGRAAGCPLVSDTRFMSPANVPPLPTSALRAEGLAAAGAGPTPGEE